MQMILITVSKILEHPIIKIDFDVFKEKSPNLRDDLMLMPNGNSLADESKRIYLPAGELFIFIHIII